MYRLFFFLSLLLMTSCAQNDAPADTEELSHAITESYELISPKNQNGLLILFPCYPCDAKNTKKEFDILDLATGKNIAVLLMNFNQHLWLSENEKRELETIIIDAVTSNHIKTSSTYIGGFSSGGNVSLLLADYLKATGSSIQPKGVFIADSPIDLYALFENAQKNIEKNFAAPAVQEANWIMSLFNSEFGVGDTSLIHYENKSPYSFKTHSVKNLANLKDVEIRLYSEPDTLWWKENRLAEYEDMNAYYIEQLSIDLSKAFGVEMVTCIKTENRGYRANGERHPHSWSIIDQRGLVDWMTSP